jgi:cyanophycin synthetase
MHVNPAKGAGVDVPGAILDTWFGPGQEARIPIFTFNTLGPESIKEIVDLVLSRFPHWNVGAVCPGGVFINRSERPKHKDYNTNVRNLLRNPMIDLLIVGYDGETLEQDGMVHVGHDMVVLDRPTPAEECLARDLRPGGTLITLTNRDVMIRRQGLVEEFTLDPLDRFGRVFLREIALIVGNMG